MRRLLLVFTLCFASCFTQLSTSPDISIDVDTLNSNLQSLSAAAMSDMNGVYSVLQGKDILGAQVVGRWLRNRWCLYASHDVVFSENAGGISPDSSITLSGYIRTVRSGAGSRINLTVLPFEGGSALASGRTPQQFIIRGAAASGENIVLKRIRPLYYPASPFHILAHRGGGRNSERLGFSENSIPMILHSEVLGATGVEIDVKRTRDGKVIVFHDDSFSPRTVRGTYLLGNVENFDLQQIKQYGQLIYGEPISTLSEVLQAVVDSTSLSIVWLDVKDPALVDEVIRIQQDAIALAKSRNRNDLMILFGIPDQEILDAYRSSSLANTTPILIELAASIALSFDNCKAWAPRWTNGIPAEDIASMHSAPFPKLVFTWTLDVRDYINDFLYHSHLDGILSNYPSLIAGMEYSRE